MNGLNDSYVESIIKKGSSGKLTAGQAAAKFGISKQYVNRLKNACAEKGAAAFRHGNRGKAKPRKTAPETEARIAELYRGKYAGFNFRHFLEKLSEDEGISITYKPHASWARQASDRRNGEKGGREKKQEDQNGFPAQAIRGRSS